MPALNFMLPAASSPRGDECRVTSDAKEGSPSPVTRHLSHSGEPAEKFQTVMERNLQSTVHSPQLPVHSKQTQATGDCGLWTGDFQLALPAVGAPVITGAKSDDTSPDSQPQTGTEPIQSTVRSPQPPVPRQAVDCGLATVGRSSGLTTATVRLSQLLRPPGGVITTDANGQPHIRNTPTGSPRGVITMDAEQPLDAFTSRGNPDSGTVPAIQTVSSVGPAVPQPAPIKGQVDLRFTNDDLRAANPSESQSQVVNLKSQIVIPASPEKSAIAGNTVTLAEDLRFTNDDLLAPWGNGIGRESHTGHLYPTGQARNPSESQSQIVNPDGGKSLPSSPGKSGETKPVAPGAEGSVEIKAQPAQPATITITVGSPRGVMALDANSTPATSTPRGESGGVITMETNHPPDASTPRGERSEPGVTPDAAEFADGTPVAQQDMTMKTAAKKTNFSGATEQKLPVAFAPVISESLPVRLARMTPATPTGSHGDFTLPTSPEGSANGAAIKPASSGISDLPPAASDSAPYVQRTREMVSLQAVQLRDSGADELRVVIKPDTGMQLSLHLRQQDGHVEVQAVLDRGNFNLLNRHWPELQQQLEARGVRVAPLSGAENNFGGGSEGFRQPTTPNGQHAGDDAELAETPVTLVPGLPTATATASASATPSRNWETWA